MLEITILRVTHVHSIPPHQRISLMGKKPGYWNKIFERVNNLPKDQCLVIEHNCGSAQELTGKCYTAAKNRGIKVKCVVRGSIAYIYRR